MMSESTPDKEMPVIDTSPEISKDISGNVADDASVANAPAESAEQPAASEMSPVMQALTDEIVGALKSVYDPEIPVDIYELGLIYRVEVTDDRDVNIDMTLTAPGCPVAEQMPVWVQDAVSALDGIGDVKVNMVFEPPWEPSRMTDEARVALNMF